MFGQIIAASVLLGGATNETSVADLGTVTVEASAPSRYRPETVSGATWTEEAPETVPCVVETLTEDFIREKNPTDLNDLLRWVPGIETGGTSLLVRQPGLFSVRGMGGTEPAFDGVIPLGRGTGLFLDPALLERVEVVKGPLAALSGGAGAQQNNNGAGGSINLHLKGANLAGSSRQFGETTSVGRDTWRQRGQLDVNEVLDGGKAAFRFAGSLDLYSPTYINQGSQDGARPREQFAFAPSFLAQPTESVRIGLKTLFVSSDSPSYIGVPVWRGKPAGGYGWYESSARRGDRSVYRGMMVNPWLDWQVTEDWLLKFGGAFVFSDIEQTTREPYNGKAAELDNFFQTGAWSSGRKYNFTTFSESASVSRSYNLYARSVYTKEELPQGFRTSFLVQPDFYYRESTMSFGTPTSRYGVALQDSLGWGWVTLLGGVRYDYFVENPQGSTSGATEFAFSPRGGVTIQPLEWLVFFGNLSETRTPTLGYRDSDGSRPTDPWVARQYEGGVRLRPLEKFWLSASCFAIDQENTPVSETIGREAFYRFEGHTRSRGVEFSASGDVTKNWTVMAQYAFTKYENLAATGKARSFERYPRQALTFNTSYRLTGTDLLDGIVLGASYRFKTKSYATMRGEYKNENLYFNPSHVFDLSASIPLTKAGGPEDWCLTFGVRNLFGAKYFETSRHYYECFVGEPRLFEVGIRGKF